MSGARRAAIALVGIAAIAGGGFAAWRVMRSPHAMGVSSAKPRDAHQSPEAPRRRAADTTGAPALDAPPREDPTADAASGAREADSAAEPMIDIPAGPPPEEGAGDDREESGLSRALFDAKVGLEALSPTAAKLSAAEGRLGREISDEARAALRAAFEKQDGLAAAAIGRMRLGEVAEDEALSAIAAARGAYLDEAAALLGVPREAAGRLLAAPSAAR